MKPSSEPSEPFVADVDVYRLQDHTKTNNGKQAVIRRIAILKACHTKYYMQSTTTRVLDILNGESLKLTENLQISFNTSLVSFVVLHRVIWRSKRFFLFFCHYNLICWSFYSRMSFSNSACDVSGCHDSNLICSLLVVSFQCKLVS